MHASGAARRVRLLARANRRCRARPRRKRGPDSLSRGSRGTSSVSACKLKRARARRLRVFDRLRALVAASVRLEPNSGVYLRKVERAVPMERPGNRGRTPLRWRWQRRSLRDRPGQHARPCTLRLRPRGQGWHTVSRRSSHIRPDDRCAAPRHGPRQGGPVRKVDVPKRLSRFAKATEPDSGR